MKQTQTIKQMELEHRFSLEDDKLSHSFALKMATIISWSVVSCVMLLSLSSGEITQPKILITLAIAIILGVITFTKTRSGLL